MEATARFVLAILIFVASTFAASTNVRAIDLIDQDEITEKFKTSLAVLIEHVAQIPPPRYIVRKAELTFAVTNGVDGQIEGKIPVGPVSGEFKGEYKNITTRLQKLTFSANPTVPTNFDDKGVLAFLTKLSDKTREDLKKSPVIVSAFEHEEKFVIALAGQGKLKFLSFVAAGVSADLKNSHTLKLYFCLMATDGGCYGG